MLKDRGIIIRFEKEGLDTSRVTSEIFFTWTSAFAQGESESLSNNVKWGKRKGYSPVSYTHLAESQHKDIYLHHKIQ